MSELKISSNTYINVGTITVLITGLLWFNREITLVKVRQEQHIENPSLHHNIVKKIELNYVTRDELDSRFGRMEDDIEEIKDGQKEILEILYNIKH